MVSRSKEIWLEAGLELLTVEGQQGLTIERLCGQTKKTKGSFYHHFSGTQDFEGQLLAYWQKAHTQDLIDLTVEAPPQEALKKLRQLTRGLSTDRELALRSWAARHEEAARVVHKVDRTRVEHLALLYVADGFPKDRARTVAWAEYSLLIGMAQLRSTLPDQQRRLVWRNFERSIRNED